MNLTSFIGNISGLKTQRGMLFEYSMDDALSLEFEFNPSSITRTRSVTVKAGELPGMRGGYDFSTPTEAIRAAQGVSTGPESFSIKIMLDATDRMNAGDPVASRMGVQPEIDILRTMLEPKTQQSLGAKTLAALGEGNEQSFPNYEVLSVLIFKWGIHRFPVFLTRAQIEMKEYLPSLLPYRAEATLSMQMIESRNPFYSMELKRQANTAVISSKGDQVSRLISDMPGGNYG